MDGKTKRPRMGQRDYFPDDTSRDGEDAKLSPGERVARAIKLAARPLELPRGPLDGAELVGGPADVAFADLACAAVIRPC